MSTFQVAQYAHKYKTTTTPEEIAFVANFYRIDPITAKNLLVYTGISERAEHLRAFEAAQAKKTPTQDEIDTNARKKHAPIVIKYE